MHLNRFYSYEAVIIRSAPAKFQFLAASKCQSDHSEKSKARFLSRVVGDPFRKGVEQGPQWMIEQASFSDLGLRL